MVFNDVSQLVKTGLCESLDPDIIIIFGSHAAGSARPDSDVDIAYLGGKKTSAYERFMVAEHLANMLDCDVDLVNLAQASTVLQMQVLQKGIVIYSKDRRKQQEFAMRVYKAYAMLSEERANAVRALERRIQNG